MELSEVKYKYSASLFLGLFGSIVFVTWIMEPVRDYQLLFGILILLVTRALISNAYTLIRENYEKRTASTIRKRIMIGGLVISLSAAVLAYFYGPVIPMISGGSLSLLFVIGIYQKHE